MLLFFRDEENVGYEGFELEDFLVLIENIVDNEIGFILLKEKLFDIDDINFIFVI